MVTKSAIVSLALLLAVLVNRSLAFLCDDCSVYPIEACGPQPPTCSYGITREICGCCDTCAKGPGEDCGLPYHGSCASGLECQLIPPGAFQARRLGVCGVQGDPTVSRNLDWIHFGNDHFVMFTQKMSWDWGQMDWDDARFQCRSHGLDLYQPKDILGLSKYLDETYSNGSWYWIGGRGNGSHQLWLSGDVVGSDNPLYEAWNNITVGTNRCLELITHSGIPQEGRVLASARCHTKRENHYALCGAAKDISTTTEFTIGNETFAVLEDFGGVSWDAANTTCMEAGYYLAEPDNLASLATYLNQNYGYSYYWLGITWDYESPSDSCVYLRDDDGSNPIGSYPCSDTNNLYPLCEVR